MWDIPVDNIRISYGFAGAKKSLICIKRPRRSAASVKLCSRRPDENPLREQSK